MDSQPCKGLIKKKKKKAPPKKRNPKISSLSLPSSLPSLFFPGVVYGHRRELKSRHGRIGLISDPEPLKLSLFL